MQAIERKLAAILAADVVGYSRLMGRDEEGTLARIKSIRRNLIEPGLHTYCGRLVKTTGDGFLIEFASVLSAFRFAASIQDQLTAEQRKSAGLDAIVFRIGINVGEIIADEGDIFGDGVNVAARLEQICPPGGICVSERAWRDLRQLDVDFRDRGPQLLKNIADPVRAFVVEPKSGLQESASRRRAFTKEPRKQRRLLVLAVGFILVAALVGWLGSSRDQGQPGQDISLTIAPTLAEGFDTGQVAGSTDDSLAANFGGFNHVTVSAGNTDTADSHHYTLSTRLRNYGSEIRIALRLLNSDEKVLFTYSTIRPYDENGVLVDQIPVIARNVIGCILNGASTYPGRLPDRALATYGLICADSVDDTLGSTRLLDLSRQLTVMAPTFGIGWSSRAAYATRLAGAEAGSARQRLREEALAALEKAKRLQPDNSEIFLVMEQLLPRRPLEPRKLLLQRAVHSHLTYGGYEYLTLGELYREMGNEKEAARQFQAAYDLNPLDPFSGSRLIASLRRLGRNGDASLLSERLRKVWPGSRYLSRE